MNEVLWLRSVLAGRGLLLSGEAEVLHMEVLRQTPWSRVSVISSADGPVYIKAVAPALRHEVPLTLLLSERFPSLLPQLYGASVADGYLLLGHGGTVLRQILTDADELWRLEDPVRRYARLQQASIDLTSELLSTGLPDRRPSRLPLLYRELLEDRSLLPIQESPVAAGLDSRALARALGHCRTLEHLAKELDGSGIPAALHHDDFHDANILIGEEGVRFIDWGEAALAHPFFSLLILFRSLAWRLKLGPDDSRIRRLTEVYLETWEAYGSRSMLREVFALAQRLETVNRALTWQSVLAPLTTEERGEDADAVAGWVGEWLKAAEEAPGKDGNAGGAAPG